MTLWHYTCDHGRAALGESGWVVSARALGADTPTGRYGWFTDLGTPIRDALGLTMALVTCDRTAHRYRVTDEAGVVRWASVRRDFPADWREDLEGGPGARPRHWWVAVDPVAVVLDERAR